MARAAQSEAAPALRLAIAEVPDSVPQDSVAALLAWSLAVADRHQQERRCGAAEPACLAEAEPACRAENFAPVPLQQK